MAFVQIIDFKSSKLDEVLALEKQWEAATAGKRTTKRRILCRDRNDASHLVQLVFFDSYESAMENSQLAETDDFAGRMMKLADGPANFADLDVIEDADG